MKEYTFICPHCGKAVEVDESNVKMMKRLLPYSK